MLFICLSDPSICLCLDLLINTQVWKQICLLDLAQLADQGGLGGYGAIGGPQFAPQHAEKFCKIRGKATWSPFLFSPKFCIC